MLLRTEVQWEESIWVPDIFGRFRSTKTGGSWLTASESLAALARSVEAGVVTTWLLVGCKSNRVLSVALRLDNLTTRYSNSRNLSWTLEVCDEAFRLGTPEVGVPVA
jgi:hypothetical protein